MATAILVDGGFYRKHASVIWGPKNAEERANELLKDLQLLTKRMSILVKVGSCFR